VLRWRGLSGVMTLALLMGVAPVFRAMAGPSGGSSPQDARGSAEYLEIHYSSPVLVRAGERVRLPVDVVCATHAGHACDATVTLGTRVGSDPWHLVSTPAAPGLQFDLTAPAMRAMGSSPGSVSGSVSFFLKAVDKAGKTTVLPPGGQSAPLRFFVVGNLRSLRIPRIPFGQLRAGIAALSLPWGSGRSKAGLSLGRRSPNVGPSGFDVDAAGHLYLMDPLQGRVTRFERGRPIASTAVSVGSDASIAVEPDGHAFVGGRMGSSIGVRGPVGTASAHAFPLGSGIVSQIKVVDGTAYARVLPLDGWIKLMRPATSEGLARSQTISVGSPLPRGGELVRVGTEDRLRIGTVVGGEMRSPVELTPPAGLAFGEVALAESDGRDGYWLVVRVARLGLWSNDQFQVIHLREGRVVDTFAAPSRSFAQAPPLARFVLGKDGALYEITSGAAGLRIIRYDTKGER
jgi:hypothetical protein